jgi:hypothetical protein
MDEFFNNPQLIFLALQSLQDYHVMHGRLPRPYNAEDETQAMAILAKRLEALEGVEAVVSKKHVWLFVVLCSFAVTYSVLLLLVFGCLVCFVAFVCLVFFVSMHTHT